MPKIVPAAGLSLTAAYETSFSLDHPIVGWKNLATSWTATKEDSNYPATNLLNPATHLKWKTGAADSPPATYIYLTAQLELAPNLSSPADAVATVDYVAIAKHNLGTIACPISIGFFDTSSPPVWTSLIPDTTLLDDGPALFRFTTRTLTQISIRLSAFTTSSPPVSTLPEIAVAYAGKLLVMPRKVYQGLVPINYGRVAKVTNGRSEAGHFLGRIVLQEFIKDTIPLTLIDPAYYLAYIDPFMESSKADPFFFAWRPQTYTAGLGYCHMTNDPMPTNEAPHGLIAMQWEMTSII